VLLESTAGFAVVTLALRDARRGRPGANPHALACPLDEEAELARQELPVRAAIPALGGSVNPYVLARLASLSG
jgi:hypothetical protein